MTAILSSDGLYRYTLEREIGGGCGNMMFVMLNPSTADANQDDPTIRRCKDFARRWGYNGLLVANLYAWRATNPRDLPPEPLSIGPEWAKHTCSLAKRAGIIVCAWGRHAPLSRQKEVIDFLRDYGQLKCFGLTKNGSPRHPLYVPGDTWLQDF